MFRALGQFVSKTWPLLLVGWICVFVVLHGVAPKSDMAAKAKNPALRLLLRGIAPEWSSVAPEGEFIFLPTDSPSLVGEELYRKAWGEPLASSLVVVVRRESSDAGLLAADKEFIDGVLRQKLAELADEERANLQPHELLRKQLAAAKPDADPDAEEELKPIVVRTFLDKSIGKLLESADKKASLVVMELPTEFMNARNATLIQKIEKLIGSRDRQGNWVPGELQQSGTVPRGLDLSLSGSATVGRDMMRAARESSRDTELWTVLLVVILLAAIYRAPLMALIPLISVAIATNIAKDLLALLAQARIVSLFSGIEVYVKVLAYGAGVDYCLFLIARYKEELDEGATFDQAVANSLAKVGHALAASASTVICGIGMMYFAEFGKFQRAGVAISFGLVVVLVASLTFSPSLLRLCRHWAFWPRVAGGRLSQTAGWVSATSLWSRFLERNWGQLIWSHVSHLVERRPGAVLLGSVLAMLPFAWIGVQFHSHLSYGLLSELPRDNASVIGADAVSQHFDPGVAGPMTLLIHNRYGSFLSEDDGKLTADALDLMEKLTDDLRDHQDQLHLADIRTWLHPLGAMSSAIANDESAKRDDAPPIRQVSGSFRDAAVKRIEAQRKLEHYVSSHADWKGKVLRLDVVLKEDPFARNSIAQFEAIRDSVAQAAPAGLQVLAIGPTASIRDLKAVTDRDQIRIDCLVIVSVFAILVLLLRRVTISFYLILSVFFSYLVALGFTFAAYWIVDPSGFVGLDWKVPMFLFTILIAVGEDYNIFLMTRIDEEQAQHGRIHGVIQALQKTGSIISSCGIIMAGTFCSLMAGSLVGLQQLGFALAFGVLLDTFVVRPVLVPAFLVLLYDGRLGSLSRLVARSTAPVEPSHSASAAVAQSGDLGGE